MSKVCRRCKLDKPVTEYYKAHRNTDRLQSYCKPCGIKNGAEWRKRPSSKIKDKQRKLITRYGVTQLQYNDLLESQNGLCKICSVPPTSKRNQEKYSLSVDHCHKTGKIRGLLCKSCNLAVGGVADNIEWAYGIAKYLKETA